MTQLEVPAGAGGVLLVAVGAQHVLELAVDGLERGVHLHVVGPQGAGGLVGPHVAQGVRGLLRLGEAGEGRHVDARAGRAWGSGGSGATGGTLEGRGGCGEDKEIRGRDWIQFRHRWLQ